MKTNANTKKELSPKQRDELLAALQARFDANQDRHPGLAWAKVLARQFQRLRSASTGWSGLRGSCRAG